MNKIYMCLLPVMFITFMGLATPICANDIHEAVKNGDIQLVLSLIDNGTKSLNRQDENGRTLLNLAIEMGQSKIADSLINRGADINLSDKENKSPLHNAAAKSNLRMAQLLLENKTTTINDTSLTQRGGFIGGWTPLHMACLNGHLEIVQLLLENGSDIEARDGIQRTPLIIAAESNNLLVAKTLIEWGADINAQAVRGYTALLWGVRNKFEEYVDLLISRNVEIAEESLSYTFQMAAINGMEGLYEYVIGLGCDVEKIRQQDPGLVFPAAEGGSVSIVKSMVEAGFDPYQVDSDGWTPLHYATSAENKDVIKYLIDFGLNIDVRNKKGESVYNLAVLKGFEEIIDFLAKCGADTSSPIFPMIVGPYMGQNPPGDLPEIFFPGVVSGHDRAHSSIAFSPDALEAYWTEMIPPEGRVAFMKAANNRWSYPITATIDRDPTFSPDGNRLYYIQTRPLKEGELPGGDPDVKEEYWFMQRTDTGWSEPISVGDEVNAIGLHWPCSVDRNGNIYFSEFNDKMYCSHYIDNEYHTPIPLTELFKNETLIGHSPFISPNRDYLLFSTNEGLKISFKKTDESWTDAIELGNNINASHMNGSPRVTYDGRYMFFTSAGGGRPWGIYWVSTDFINQLRADRLLAK